MMVLVQGYDTNATTSQLALRKATLTNSGTKTGLDVSIINTSDANLQSSEDTSFIAGDSPATIDCNAALSRNATQGYVRNDGAGSFTVSLSADGTAWGDEVTVKSDEALEFNNISVDSIRITWVADSAYRVTFL